MTMEHTDHWTCRARASRLERRPTQAGIRGLAGVAVVALAGACSTGESVPAPKNLLVIAVDTLRADVLGVLGGPRERTPHIDALASSSIVFTNAVSHASWTLPSFASTLTSTYSSTHGCWTFESRLPESFHTLPEVFQEAGFDTYGVASHIFFNEKYGLQQGFDDFDQRLGFKRGGKQWVEVTSPIVSSEGVQWLDGRAENPRPWLLWLHFFDPHMPYVDHGERAGAPPTEPGKSTYIGEVTFTDKYVGDVLGALERNGFAADTVVVFLSDHGEAFGEHAGVESHSYSLFDEELHVPLILHVPGLQPRRVDRLTRTLDLMPTLLDLFALEGPTDQMLGHSLLPTLKGEPQVVEPLLSEIRLKVDGKHRRALSDGRWKLIEGLNGELELYDHDVDRREEHDRATDQGEDLQRLLALMDAIEAQARERGQAFAPARALEHDADEMARIKAMGYAGDSED